MPADSVKEILKYASKDGPTPTIHYIDLPLTKLHYAKCGEGTPLIMVPATISRLQEWIALTQFFAKHHTVYFFELPGHGGSTAFEKPFNTQQVAETVGDFVDALGFDKVSILGFSFGGLLTMRTIYHLEDRVEKVILYAPALTKKAIILPRIRIELARILIKLLRISKIRSYFASLFKGPRSLKFLNHFLIKFGRVDSGVSLDQIREKLSDKTLEVLTYQLEEVFDLEWPIPTTKLSQTCCFGMSVNDTMLDYKTTLNELRKHFKDIRVAEFDFPYHQPPKRPTLEELKVDFMGFLELLD
ncbi:alpha/beta hydrolase [candidate division WWE3 bacterium]|jgi:pimeloyl-ACP methyl ester carboxylesterase|nr:alpha/beta hydrolase [candidate division WWE3 bacterium]MBT7349271.1 alpha/beta hydrolase [candidate division WWE3 bacterium]